MTDTAKQSERQHGPNAHSTYCGAVERCAYRIEGVANALKRVGMDRIHAELSEEVDGLLELAVLLSEAHQQLSRESYASANSMASAVLLGIVEGVIGPKDRGGLKEAQS